MRIPMMRYGKDDSPIAWWEWLFAPIVCPLAIAALALLALLSLVVLPIHVVYVVVRERRIVRRLRANGRFVPWSQLEPRLRSGEGTLIVAQAQKDAVRIWWTPEDVATLSPVLPPHEDELDYFMFGEPNPFVVWCLQEYLHVDSGRALLTTPPGFYSGGFVTEAFFKDKFPGLHVIMTVKLPDFWQGRSRTPDST